MSRTRKPRKPYCKRLVKIPMIGEGELHRMMAMQLHASLAQLRIAPSVEAFDAVGGLLNLASLTITDDPRFAHEARLIAGGCAAANQIAAKVQAIDGAETTGPVAALREIELRPIEIAASTFDRILGRLDITKIYLAQVKLREMRQREAMP